MIFINLNEEYHGKFLEFNKRAYPARKDVRKRFEFQVLENPLLQDNTKPDILIAIDKNSDIIGQMGSMPAEYNYDRIKKRGYIGFDLYIKEGYRNKGYAVRLSSRLALSGRLSFGIGLSEGSERIFLSFLKGRIVGELHQFLWKREKELKKPAENIFENLKLPEMIDINDIEFRRIYKVEGWQEYYWNESTIEFSRSQEFLRWRFLKRPDIYHFYLLDSDPKTYFVVRKSRREKLNLLAMVDYKMPYKDYKKFRLILKAVKLLAATIGFDGVVTMSSLNFFDKELEKSLFFKYGNSYQILTREKIDLCTREVTDRDVCCITMADGDTDLYYDSTADIFG